MGRFDQSDDGFGVRMVVEHSTEPRPDVTLEGNCDGNANSIIGHVKREMRRAKCSREWIETYAKEARSGDYDHVFATTFRFVNVIG